MANHSVNRLINYNYPEISAEPKYRAKVIPYLNYLRNHKDTKIIAVSQSSARPYYHNLYGYLTSLGYDVSLHWPIMVLSGLPSPEALDETVKTLTIPSIALIDEIKTIITS